MTREELFSGLDSLTKSEVLSIYRDANGGRLGFDHERSKKPACIDRLLQNFPLDVVSASLERHLKNPSANPIKDPVAPANQKDVAQQIAALFATLAGTAVNEDKVRDIVKAAVADAIAASPVTKIEFTRVDGSTFTPDGHVRAEFKDALLRAQLGLNIMLVGPAGCGKTHFAHQISEALGRPFAAVSCTAGMSESVLAGWLIPGKGGEFEYLESDFVRLYEQGGVFLFDEFDAADPNTLLFVNQALANGSFYVPQRRGNSVVRRHKDFVCIAACNTYGTGANMTYAGRERLDEATLDRFRAGMIELGYDKTLERAAVDADVVKWGWSVREKIAASKLTRVMSTRFLLDASKLVRAGQSLADVQSIYFTGWKQDERSKVGA